MGNRGSQVAGLRIAGAGESGTSWSMVGSRLEELRKDRKVRRQHEEGPRTSHLQGRTVNFGPRYAYHAHGPCQLPDINN